MLFCGCSDIILNKITILVYIWTDFKTHWGPLFHETLNSPGKYREDTPNLQMSSLRLVHSDTRQNSLASNPGLLNPRSVPISLDKKSLPKSRPVWTVVDQPPGLLPLEPPAVSGLPHTKDAITHCLGHTGPLNSPYLISPLQGHWPSVSPFSSTLSKLSAFSPLTFSFPSFSRLGP